VTDARELQPVRVLQLIKGLGTGGAERIVWWTLRASDRKQIRYEVAYVVPWADSMVERIQQTGAPVHCLGTGQPLDLGVALRLRRLLLERVYDVVHVHSPLVAGIARVVVRTLPRSRRPALVSTEHCTWSSYRVATQLVNAALYRGDDQRFASSQQVYRSIWPWFRTGTEVLVHGLMRADLDLPVDGRDAVRAELGVPADAVVVTTVANYRAQKGYPDLLTAARKVVDAVPGVVFLAIGYGPDEAAIRRLRAELGLEDTFRLLGQRHDVMRILGCSDVFALASRYEGGPIAVMEAMAAGLPVVVPLVGFVPDVVTDGVEGWVVEPGRPDQLAERLIDVTTDEALRHEMGRAALKRSAKFDVAEAVASLQVSYIRQTRTRQRV
jgi:glycosyltransferase involved in cell wall biosynthesis